MLSKKTISPLLFFFFTAVCLFLFYIYSQIPIKSWDEAVYANNAIEMSKNHNWWVMHNNGVPDFYNTKPPLIIWFQSVFIQLFGVSEIAIRLPSFISLLILVVFLLWFLKKTTGSSSLSFYSLCILLTSPGFLGPHAAMTGDLDLPLTLWTTLITLIFFDKIILNDSPPKTTAIYLIYVLFLGGFLTKSSAVFLPVPSLLLSVFIFKRQKSIFKNKHFYIGAAFFCLLVVSYYVVMESNNPGYFNHAWTSEYKRIYANIMPWHAHAISYYFYNLIARFTPWVWFLVPAVLLGVNSKSTRIKKLTIFSSIFCACYLIMISIPVVKLEWYDIPLYPFLAILIGVFFYEIVTRLQSWFPHLRSNPAWLLVAFFTITALLFSNAVHTLNHPKFKEPLEREGTALNQLINDKNITGCKVLMQVDHPEHYNQLNFYREKFMQKKGRRPDIASGKDKIGLNDTVLVCQADQVDSLKTFKSETIRIINGCVLLRIIGYK